jgi:hypothetical protein
MGSATFGSATPMPRASCKDSPVQRARAHSRPTENAMPRKVKSVRVPEELSAIDLSGIIAECEKYLRDLESVAMLNQQGEREAAEALLRARQADLGRRVGLKVWEARKQAALERLQKGQNAQAAETA